jgi:hypothetical protein
MTSNAPTADAASSAVLDAAAPAGPPTVTRLAEDATALVEIAAVVPAGVGQIVIVSRARQAQACLTAIGGERLTVPLASGDYLVAALPQPDAAVRPHTVFGRFLVYAGRAYGYGMPTPLADIPPTQAGSGTAPPRLARLAYAGRSSDGMSQLVLQWTPAGATQCLCIRSPQWGGQWLPYATPLVGGAFRLLDGAYEVRAAHLAEDRTRLGAWSEVTAFTIAEGHLAAGGVSTSDSPLLAQMAAPVADASVAWVPLSPGAFTEFVMTPVSTLAAGQDLSAVDLCAMAYGRAAQPDGCNADIVVSRALAQGDLAADRMAAAGDYFVRAGRIDSARHVFEELGRRYRGADFALLRCAQLEALSGRHAEARELLQLALLPPKDDPTRSQRVGAPPKEAPEAAQALSPGTPENKAQLAALRFKAQQYDRLMHELPALRAKAKRYDEAQGKAAGGQRKGKGVAQLLRRWSDRLPGLRPR